MSLAIRFTDLRPALDFLRWLAQPQLSRVWYGHDCIYARKVVERRGQRKRARFELLFWFPHAAEDDGALNQAYSLVKEANKNKFNTLPDSLDGYRKMSLDDLLTSINVVQPKRRRRQRRNLMLALYDADRAALADVFASAPKNPLQPTTITFLDQREKKSSEVPRFLIHLPQADANFHWDVWLESENLRLAGGGPRKLKMFSHLGSGSTSEYFVEYGWVHPLPEICDLHTNDKGGNPILISGQDREGQPGTKWLHVTADSSDTQIEVERDDDQLADVELHLSEQPIDEVVARSPSRQPLELAPRVEPLAIRQRDGFRSIDGRIRGLQRLLFQLESQRSHLAARGRERFRLLLRFAQSAPAQGEDKPRLAENFARFLLLSRRQLNKLGYLFLEDHEEGSGWHVVVTNEPVFYQDVHSGLADDVYYQPQHWSMWNLNAFVRDDCQLVPAMDDEALGVKLREVLAQRSGSPERLVLLDVPETEQEGMKLTVLPAAPSGDMSGQLELLNLEFPLHEIQSRQDAREELERSLKQLQVDLEAEVEVIEKEFKEQAAKRLLRLQQNWNALAPQIDAVARRLEKCHSQFGDCDEILEDFAVAWRMFVDKVNAFNHTLIKAKLDALDALDRKEQQWKKMLDDTERSNTDISKTLPPLEDKIRKHLAVAKEKYEQAKEYYDTYLAQAEAAEVALRGLCKRVGDMLAEGRKSHSRIKRADAEFEAKNRELDKLLAALKQLLARLDKHKANFGEHLAELQKQQQRTVAAFNELNVMQRQLDEARAKWRTQLQQDTRRFKEVMSATKAARAEINIYQAEQQQLENRADALKKLVEQQLETTQFKHDKTKRRHAKVQARIDRLKAHVGDLNKAANGLQACRQNLIKLQDDRDAKVDLLRDAAQQLAQDLKNQQAEVNRELDEVIAQLQSTADTLQRMTQLELELEPLDSFRRAVELRRGAVAVFHDFRPVAELDPQGEIWNTAALEEEHT